MVRVLDSDLDTEGRVTLTITLDGSLSIQTFRESGSGGYRLQGAVILPAEMICEWAETLYLMTRLHVVTSLRLKSQGQIINDKVQ